MKVTVEKLEITTSAPFRSPFKFGAAVMTALTLQEVHLRVSTPQGEAVGLGSMPLGNAWSYPGVPYETSLDVMQQLSARFGKAMDGVEIPGGNVWDMSARLREIAMTEARALQHERADLALPIPDLCALVTFSPWDLALFDGWGRALGGNTFELLRSDEAPAVEGYRTAPLSEVLTAKPQPSLAIYHVVGGLDALTPDEVKSSPGDDLPDDLQGWMARDGLTNFKIKLQGKDPEWDFQRVAAVDEAVVEQARREGRSENDLVFSLDLNEQCPSGEILADLLERLKAEKPRAFNRIAFVEQPTSRAFSGSPEEKVHRAAKLKPVVIDEGLVDADAMRRALENGYNGLCLKTCKGFGFSIQMAAVAKGEGLYLCVQDLTCPGMAYLESASLASRVGVDGLEANARQFCPGANDAAAAIHPEAFELKGGSVDATKLDGPGLGMKLS